MAEEIKLVKKSAVHVDEYADAFGYTFYPGSPNKIGSISFFKIVTEWPEHPMSEDDIKNIPTVLTRYNIATIKMSETHLLKLAQFILDQHKESQKAINNEPNE